MTGDYAWADDEVSGAQMAAGRPVGAGRAGLGRKAGELGVVGLLNQLLVLWKA